MKAEVLCAVICSHNKHPCVETVSAAQPHSLFQSEILQFGMKWRASVLEKTWGRVCNKSYCWDLPEQAKGDVCRIQVPTYLWALLPAVGWGTSGCPMYLTCECWGKAWRCSSVQQSPSALGVVYIRTMKKDWSEYQRSMPGAFSVNPEALKLNMCMFRSLDDFNIWN